MSFMDKISFSNLTHALDKCATATSVAKREKYLERFFEVVFKLQQRYRTERPDGNPTLYPLLRMILASEEHERSYGIQEKKLRSLLVKSLGMHGEDKKKIEQCNENDIADEVYEAIKTRHNKESKLSIAEVDQALNELADNQKTDAQKYQLDKLILNGSAGCLKWIVKVILKSKIIRLSTSKVLDKYHPCGGKLFTKYNHLSEVVKLIETGKAEEGLRDVVKPFTPVRAMLSQKFTREMSGNFEKHEFYQEVKMDGERFQLHMENQTFKYFSRNAHEFSDNFNVLLSPLIKFKSVTHSVILDGEMLIWNKISNRFVTKGETDMDVKRLKSLSYHLRPCYCAFDILYLNGTSFINEPYYRRFEILKTLFDDQVGVLVKTKPIKIQGVEHLVMLFNDAMKKEEEGLILKRADSHYMPGEREKGGWFKMKADYFDSNVVKDFDCVILGGTFQNPHTRDIIQKYHLGAIEKQSDGNFNVFAIGEVAQGVSNNERVTLHEKLMKSAQTCRSSDGSEIEFERGKIFLGLSRPNVIIPPHKSVVVQIRASELMPSKEQYTKYTFRFPRIETIRNDKFWDESCTLQEFQSMYTNDRGQHDRRVVKMNQRVVDKNDIYSPEKKKARIMQGRSRARAIEDFSRNSQEDIEPIDSVLGGLEFCVKSSSKSLPSVHELKALLQLHGASLTEFPRKKKTFAVIAGDIEQQVKIYIREKSHSIIKADWIVKSLTKDTPLDDRPKLKPLDFHFMTDEMYETNFKSEFDRFGDSYHEPLQSVEELMEIVKNMKTEQKITTEEVIALEKEICEFADSENFNFFRGKSATFIHDGDANMMMDWSKIVFQFRAGEVCTEIRPSTLIFVDRETFKAENHPEVLGRKIIDYNFILDSNESDKMIGIEKYLLSVK